MAYQPVDYGLIQHRDLRKVLMHSDMMLHDLYNIFKLPNDLTAKGGGGSFSIAVILLCIVDGLAVYLYPTKKVDDQEKRFKQLLREKLHWGQTTDGWVEKGLAAKQLYLEMRNPLVHELGADKATSARIGGHDEPRIGKWGNIPEGLRDIDQIQSMAQWNNNWPILAVPENKQGRQFVQFSGAAMWWAVKKMTTELINDETAIQNATEQLSR